MKKKSDAREIINRLVSAIQRYRSNLAQTIPKDLWDVSVELQPLMLGDKFLPILVRLADGDFTPMDFYNMMALAEIAAPAAQIAYGILWEGEELPLPDIALLTDGWEDEDE